MATSARLHDSANACARNTASAASTGIPSWTETTPDA